MSKHEALMNWNRWYATKSYFSSALWIIPLIALILENVAIRLVFGLHEQLNWIPWVLGITSIVAFLFLIDYTARLLRPISIVWRIGEQGIGVVESVYLESVDAPRVPRVRRPLVLVARTVEHQGRAAIMLAVNLK